MNIHHLFNEFLAQNILFQNILYSTEKYFITNYANIESKIFFAITVNIKNQTQFTLSQFLFSNFQIEFEIFYSSIQMVSSVMTRRQYNSCISLNIEQKKRLLFNEIIF